MAEPGSLVCDGQPACVRGTFVRVSAEYVGWDVFRKFRGKVGMLTWRHFSGMWYADFPGEDEYGFLSGPLLFQLSYSSEKEAHESAVALEKQRKEDERRNTLESQKSKQLVLALEKRAKEMSATTVKLFEQMAIIQEEMRKTEIDMNTMDRAFTHLTTHANSVDAELTAANSAHGTVQSEKMLLEMQLGSATTDVHRMTRRVQELVAENTKYQKDLSDYSHENATLSKQLKEKQDRNEELELENGSFKKQVQEFEEELTDSKTHLTLMDERFLAAREETATLRVVSDNASTELQNIEEASTAGVGMGRAERDALLEEAMQLQRDLELMTKLRDEAEGKFDDMMNDKELFVRLASAKHGAPALGGSTAVDKVHTRTRSMDMSDNELVALSTTAQRADIAEREMQEMRTKLMRIDEDAKNGKQVPGLLRDIQGLNGKMQQQKELAERNKQESTKTSIELRNQRQDNKLLTAEKEKLDDGLQKMTSKRDALVHTVEEKQIRIDTLILELETTTQEEASQRARAAGLYEDKTALIAEKAELQHVLSVHDTTINEFAASTEGLRRENAILTRRKSELEEQLLMAQDTIKEIQERERNAQAESDVKIKKSEARIQDLQDDFKMMGTVRVELQVLREKHKTEKQRATETIEELENKNAQTAEELVEAIKVADANQKIVRLYYQKIEHKISVPPKQVLFKLWHYHTVATKYWNADDTQKAQQAAVRKSKNESQSLRLRLVAAQRLVEEMQRRDKCITSAKHLLAPPPSGASGQDPLSYHLEGASASSGSNSADAHAAAQLSAGTPLRLTQSGGSTTSAGTGLFPLLSAESDSIAKRDATTDKSDLPSQQTARDVSIEKRELLSAALLPTHKTARDADVQGSEHDGEETDEDKDLLLAHMSSTDGLEARAKPALHKIHEKGPLVLECTECLVHAMQMQGTNQRNTRLQREVVNFEDKTKTLTLNNDHLNLQLADLKRQMHLIGCLRLAEKFAGSIKERKSAVQARTLCQAMTVALLDKERSLPMVVGGGNRDMSPIAARKAELEADALARGSTLEQETKRFRSNKYADILMVADASPHEQHTSIFEQLDSLTGQVTDLVSRHDTHTMRRRRKEQDAKDRGFAATPPTGAKKPHLLASLKTADPTARGHAGPRAPTPLPPRPQTAHY